MADWIKWCNENQGYVTALLTLVLALLTLIYVVTTIVIASLSRKSLKLLVDSEIRRTRPQVIFNVFTENRIAFASIKNYGLTPATDISVAIKPNLSRAFDEDDDESALTSQTISFLPPNFEVKDSLGGSIAFYQKYQNPVFSGEVGYKDTEGNSYKEQFHIDLNPLRKRLYTSETPVSKSLEKISGDVTELKEVFQKWIESSNES